jgi:hypothetical protein
MSQERIIFFLMGIIIKIVTNYCDEIVIPLLRIEIAMNILYEYSPLNFTM